MQARRACPIPRNPASGLANTAPICSCSPPCQALSALTARGAIYRKQDGGRLLGWAMACALLAILTFAALHQWSVWPLSWSLAPWPLALITAMLFAKVFAPRSPKPVGWALAGASAVSLLLFGLGLATA